MMDIHLGCGYPECICSDDFINQMNKYRHFFAIQKKLNKAGYDIDRKEIISLATNGHKRSLQLLSDKEYIKVINYMNYLVSQSGDTKDDIAKNRLRRKVISLLIDLGYVSHGKADMKRIYNWVLKYGYYHKPLNRHSREELIRLIGQVSAYFNKVSCQKS